MPETIPCTLDAIVIGAKGYAGTVHGDTLTGECDVEFPTMHHAASFADTYVALGWTMDVRAGDVIASLASPVVLTITGLTPTDRIAPEHRPEIEPWQVSDCAGHESLLGAHMGETVYCDGTCAS